ncbi:MAG: CtsR family transcriptional regulator [Clostridia bacterium]|nr:CtsR family transcriptional regulator [Clostridia bacterium]
MLISDAIAKMIEEMLDEGDGSAELRRNDLAAQLGCVPSQINYVITSRFTPSRGYVTESRRGGGGYIRIVRVPMDRSAYLMHFFQAVGGELDEGTARAFIGALMEREIVSPREASLIAAAVAGTSLDAVPQNLRDGVRADVFRHILLSLMS